MSNFTRTPTTTQTQMTCISNAYKLAGISEPSRALAISKLIEDTPTTEQVTDRLAQEALTATNPDEFYTEALTAIRDAQAADAFRTTFAQRLHEHSNSNMPDTLERTVNDLTPAFDTLAKQIGTAARKLPAATPLDVGANIENDTAPEYKTVRDGLAKLGTYLSIYIATQRSDLPRELSSILALVTLPTANIERVAGLARQPINEDQLTGTRSIRALADSALDNLDHALIQVARGDWDGISLNLATPAELRTRTLTAHTAYTATRVEDTNAMHVYR